MGGVAEEKRELRRELRGRLAGLSPRVFQAEGRGALGILRELPLWGAYSTALVFLSAGLEIDTAPLLEAALAAGKAVFAPAVLQERLLFRRVRSPKGPWNRGSFGIREPAAGEELTVGDFPALVFTPGLGFDREGGRLGRGKGFYDRFFAELDSRPGGRRPPYLGVGLCTSAQMVPRIPVEGGDRFVDAVCTGEEFFFAGGSGVEP